MSYIGSKMYQTLSLYSELRPYSLTIALFGLPWWTEVASAMPSVWVNNNGSAWRMNGTGT